MMLRTRFAPSPTGRLHLGHAFSALCVAKWANTLGAEMLLRIEDIDTTRCRPEFIDGIFEDLNWLGLVYDSELRRQSQHFAEYDACVSALAERGLAYRCFRTRQEVEAVLLDQGQTVFRDGAISREEEADYLERGVPFAWRLSLSQARTVLGEEYEGLEFQIFSERGVERFKARPEQHGDIVIARKDSPSAYHLAATHDDAVQGITHIVRGEDLADAPHIQVLLQALLGWPRVLYHHHDLVLGRDGEKLSKSQASLPLAALRADGMTPADIRKRLGFLD